MSEEPTEVSDHTSGHEGNPAATANGAEGAGTADGARPTDPAGAAGAGADGEGVAARSAGSRRAGGRHGKPRGRRSAVVEVVLVVVLSLALSSLIKTFLVQAFFVPSESMENTLKVHDRILVSKLTPRFKDVHRGDVVVFQDPGGWLDPSELPHRSGVAKVAHDLLVDVGVLPDDTVGDLVKRVIGVGGDHVVCCNKQGAITVNGAVLKEPYLYPGNQPSDVPFDVTVPRGYIWVMGDHRGLSRDSRAHIDDPRHGMVPVSNVLGRVFVIIWPVSRWDGVGRPDSFAAIPPPSSSSLAPLSGTPLSGTPLSGTPLSGTPLSGTSGGSLPAGPAVGDSAASATEGVEAGAGRG